MRLGGPIFADCSDPERWISEHQRLGYRAAYCPLGSNADDDVVRSFSDAAHRADIIIAEVGAWSNPLSPDDATRSAALEHCKKQLDLADRIGARCCVNISGSRGEQWDGPHPANLTQETFDLIVDSVRDIIDAVEPTRTYYTLETMPWMYPDSTQSYIRLIEAIDRPQFAVHFDAANLLCSPQRFFGNAELIRDFISLLGPKIRSCHAKDIALGTRMTTHLDEVRPGLGGLDYAVLLRELDTLDPDMPLMLEHLPNAEEYNLAADYVRSVAGREGVAL